MVFGSLFWTDLYLNQQEIANTPLPPSPLAEEGYDNPVRQEASTEMSSQDNYDAIENDLDSTNLDDLDSGVGDIEAEINSL